MQQRILDEITQRQANVLRQAQDCESGDPFAAGLRRTYNELEDRKTKPLAELQALAAAGPITPVSQTAELLDALPYLSLNLANAPQELLRRLFVVTRLTIRLHPNSDTASLSVTLPGDSMPEIARVAERITNIARTHEQPSPGRGPAVGCVVDMERAPGGDSAYIHDTPQGR